MNKFFKGSFLAVALVSAVLITSCSDEDPPLPDNTTQFQASTQGLAATQTEATVTITLTRAVETAGNIVISYTATGLTYGPDFITAPVIDANNKIVIPVAVGATSATFTVTKTNTTGLQGDEKIDFTIDSLPDGLVIGTQNTFTLSFSEIIAVSATMEINGGGTNAQNRVFIDLSGNRQTAVARTTWDLAFSSKADEFRVYLNSSNKMLARAIDKNDLTEVTSEDAADFDTQVDLPSIFNTAVATPPGQAGPDWLALATSWMDDPTDTHTTAIAEVDADEDNNLVYIVNRGYDPSNTSLGWLKIRVIRDGNNFKLEYADIDDVNFATATITKNAATNLTYFSFTTENIVTVEPNSGDWDIAWTGLTNETPLGGPPLPLVPYYFQDMIIQNTTGVTTAQVSTATVTYEAYAESDIANTTFAGDNQINIGSSWRRLPQDGSAPSAYSDRFYVIKDGAGNVYKLQFTSVLSATGERGKPSFKFDLVKKGA